MSGRAQALLQVRQCIDHMKKVLELLVGSDMALAFVAHLGGDKLERFLRGQVEIAEREQDDDPFAEFHGLV